MELCGRGEQENKTECRGDGVNEGARSYALEVVEGSSGNKKSMIITPTLHYA